jgi:hypothetical protein
MRKSTVFAAALVAGMFGSGAAMAFDRIGTVDVYHVNLDVGGDRTGCIQMRSPGALPNGWGCVYGTGNLANYINDLLREAALDTKRCRVFWTTTDGNGFAKITAAECGPRH